MSGDRELEAMAAVLEALKPLEQAEQRRILLWATQKLELGAGATSAASIPPLAPAPGDDGGYSTDTIATLIGATSGTDLIIAAAAHLSFTQGKNTFTRKDLSKEMRNSPSRFKHTFINNMSSYLGALTRTDRLRMSGPDTYALSSRERQSLQAALAAADK